MPLCAEGTLQLRGACQPRWWSGQPLGSDPELLDFQVPTLREDEMGVTLV